MNGKPQPRSTERSVGTCSVEHVASPSVATWKPWKPRTRKIPSGRIFKNCPYLDGTAAVIPTRRCATTFQIDPQRRVAGARPVAVAANEPGCLRISLLVCRLPFLSWLWRRSGCPTAFRNTHPGWTSESTEAHEGGIRPTINAGPMADGASRMIDGAAVHVSSAQRGSRIGGEDAAHSPPPSNEKVLDGSPGYHYEDLQPFGRCFQLRLDGTPESRCAGRTGEAAVITGEGTQSASTTPTRPSIHT